MYVIAPNKQLCMVDGCLSLAELERGCDRFQIVFSDVVMPGMSGIDLAREVRRLYPDVPVVLASGYSDVLAQSGSHGFELLHKPYSAEQLSRDGRAQLHGHDAAQHERNATRPHATTLRPWSAVVKCRSGRRYASQS